MTIEKIVTDIEFEQNISHECERKFLPIFPEQLESLRAESFPIEQFYLSHPDEPFSLRMRETFANGELSYEVTLKDTGTFTADGINRIEVTAPIDAALYRSYKSSETPVLRKLRAEPVRDTIVDFYEDGSIQVESESPESWSAFTRQYGSHFVETTGQHASSNEWRAHLSFRRNNEGREALIPQAELAASDIVRDIIEKTTHGVPITVHVGGRSGSGKSTIVREVITELASLGISANVMSTDDYHRGVTWLEQYNNGEPWVHWDDSVVYDTGAMAEDLANLRSGLRIYQRHIDWTVVEPVYDGLIEPRDVLIIEGIYATSQDITNEGDPSYMMATPLATCVGRRLIRDMRERPEFADPVKSLSYMLTEAEPAYRAQHGGVE